MWPCNVNNSHWVLVVAFVQEKKIAVYDSLGPGYHREKAKHNVIQTLFECTWFPTSCVIIVVSQLAGCAATVAPDGLPLRHPPVAAPYGCFYGRVQRAHAVGHRRHHCSDHANQNFRVDRLRSHLDAAQLGHGKFASQLPTWGQNTQAVLSQCKHVHGTCCPSVSMPVGQKSCQLAHPRSPPHMRRSRTGSVPFNAAATISFINCAQYTPQSFEWGRCCGTLAWRTRYCDPRPHNIL